MRLSLASLALALSACSAREVGREESVTRDEIPGSATETAPDGGSASRCAEIVCASIEHCDEETGACAPACPLTEVYIPATGPGGFMMGKGFTVNASSNRIGKGHALDSDRPHSVVLTRPFCMDETEVTVAAMLECVDSGHCEAPKIAEIRANYPKKLDHPVNEIAFRKAKAYCAWRGKALPTEAQWEWAATGGDGRTWPWGDEAPTCEHADFVLGLLISPGGNSGCGGGGTSPVKSHPRGNKIWPTGALYDLAGNVWEWCEDSFAPYPTDAVTDPVIEDPASFLRVVRGGGWNRSVRGIETAFRGAAVENYEVPGLGFRCIRNAAH